MSLPDHDPSDPALYGPAAPPPMPLPSTIAEEILRQTAACGAGRSIGPSDVARALGGVDWRPLLTPVRNAAVALAAEGRVLVLRKGKPIPPDDVAAGVKGVIRLAAPGDPA